MSLIFAALAAANPAVAAGRDAPALYAELCARCHGPNLEGGKGGGLVDRAWRHGKDEPSLVRSILEGTPAEGMPAFASSVSAEEAGALAVFVREAGGRKSQPVPASDQPFPEGVIATELHGFRVETVAEGIEVPWSMTFLPGDRILVTERGGRLRLVERGRLRPALVGGLPPVATGDEAGLLSVVAHPDFAANGWVYLSYCDPGPDDTAMLKIVRARLRDWTLEEHETIFAFPRERYQPGRILFGGRLAFSGAHLFFSVGVRGTVEGRAGTPAQDVSAAQGKIHRVYHDGRVPEDNPFRGQPGAIESIWALGVRNPQGLAIDPRDGGLWETEHGPRGGDELNRIERGRNYGWPTVTHGMNYDGTPIAERSEAPGMESPVVDWTPSIAVSQIEFYSGGTFSRWRNDLLVGSLATQLFLRLRVQDGRVVHREEIFRNHGRIRDIKTGPDGLIYLAIELVGKPGKIVRLVPAEGERRTGAQ